MKNNKKEKLFEILNKLNPEINDDWAIFQITKGYGKCFATSIESGIIHICDYSRKYSDPEVIKLPLEKAKNFVEKNYSQYTTLGIVNANGLQMGLGRYDRVWQRI